MEKTHRYFLYFDNQNEAENVLSFSKEYEQWRNTLKHLLEDECFLSLNQVSTFREILLHASATKLPITIGESHIDFTSKAILIHNIALLKEKKAILFIEGYILKTIGISVRRGSYEQPECIYNT